MCHGCRMPITDDDKESKKYIRGVACPKCFDSTSDEQKSRYMSRQKQIDLAKERNQKHIGPKEEIRLIKNELPILYSFKRCPYAMRARMALKTCRYKM